jgi:hypothetical protein
MQFFGFTSLFLIAAALMSALPQVDAHFRFSDSLVRYENANHDATQPM